MPEPTTESTVCSCKEPYWQWQLAACNEEGWHCAGCRLKAPGEPPGYRPDLDRSEIEEKVSAVLMHLHNEGLIYISNSTDGECYTGMAAKACRKSGYFDQYSIISAIIAAKSSHAEYWRKIGEDVLAAKDGRDRCCECRKLANHWSNGKAFCSDHGPSLFANLIAEPRDPNEPEPPDPWQAYADWAAKWREDHPDDERDELELVEIYGKEGVSGGK